MIESIQDLYAVMKNNAVGFVGEDVAVDDITQAQLQKSSLDLLADNKISTSMLDDKMVILMHQGYVFSCVKRTGLNGPVYTFSEETMKILVDVSTVDDFLLAYGK